MLQQEHNTTFSSIYLYLVRRSRNVNLFCYYGKGGFSSRGTCILSRRGDCGGSLRLSNHHQPCCLIPLESFSFRFQEVERAAASRRPKVNSKDHFNARREEWKHTFSNDLNEKQAEQDDTKKNHLDVECSVYRSEKKGQNTFCLKLLHFYTSGGSELGS